MEWLKKYKTRKNLDKAIVTLGIIIALAGGFKSLKIAGKRTFESVAIHAQQDLNVYKDTQASGALKHAKTDIASLNQRATILKGTDQEELKNKIAELQAQINLLE